MRVLLIDDHVLFTDSLRCLLREMSPETEVVAASCIAEAMQHTAPVDLILLDQHLPDGDGLGALTTLKCAFPQAPVVVVSGDAQPHAIQAAMGAGAMGYVPKSSSPGVLVAAMRLILSGGVYLPTHLLHSGTHPAEPGDLAPTAYGADPLSDRQREVLRQVMEGKTNKQIARELGIAESTVKSHLSTAFRVLGVANRTEAVFKTAQAPSAYSPK